MGEASSKMVQAISAIWPRNIEVELPARVTDAISQNDDVSDILVKIIQLVVFTLWLVAWLAAPQPAPDTVSRVPLVLSLYLMFTVAMLAYALVRRTPSWMIYLSAVLDMALLTYLIWTFHIQYGQPASFSLKVVEVVNFFVLISLRGLRFEARYVIAAGAAAVCGWASLVLYVIVADPSDPMITRDYVTYLTSNRVLIGAEVSKMISMIMFTIILAIAVRRAHSFLVHSVAEGSAAKDLSRFLASSVAEQIRGADQMITAGDGERRDVAIVNVDIRGFTRMVADMPPDRAMKLLSKYQHVVVPIAHQHDGSVDKFMGDGIMITFGAYKVDTPHCANALRCIDEIMTAVSATNGELSLLEINLAAASGPVIVGAVGDGDRLEVTVIGASVNLSAKLEKHNKTLKSRALCSETCFNIAVAQGYHDRKQRQIVSTIVGDDDEPQNVVVLE